MAKARGDRYFDVWVPLMLTWLVAEDEPLAAVPVLEEARAAATASGMRSLREMASLAEAELACSTGDLSTAIELTTNLLRRPWDSWWPEIVRIASLAAFLTEDEPALQVVVDAAKRGLRSAAGSTYLADRARHRRELLHHRPSVVTDFRELPPRRCSTLWLAGRESIDAAAEAVAVSFARFWGRPAPYPSAVVAAIEAAATGDGDRWHAALAIALDQGLRLIAVDALEGLAGEASRVESWAECLRLLGAAERLRDETGYRWRFGFEQRAVDAARAAAVDALGDEADATEAEGRDLEWRDAAAYARRARGERKRPQHGWASLTPTEHGVVALVAEGMTNAQIAERLLMGRATVKTHLDHVFTKLGIRTRAALAAEATRRNST
jgi:DNA-binding CsgD family transcriptional regulator